MGVDFRVYRHRVPEGVDLEPLDRWVKRDGETILASEVTNIDIRIFKIPERTLIYQSLAISSGNGTTGPIFNTLQVDGRWRLGDPGYNGRHTITRAALAVYSPSARLQGGNSYRVEIELTHSTEGIMFSAHEYQIESNYGRSA